MRVRLSHLLPYVVLPVLMGGCLLCVLIGLAAVLLAPEGLNPAEAIVLRLYLLRENTALNTPKSTDTTLQRFVVEENDTARTIGIRLVTQGFINNGTLFERYVRYERLDTQLRAGTFLISPSMTIPQIARTLTNPSPTTVRFTVIEGWRKEQIAAALDTQTMLTFSGNDFLAIVSEGAPLPPDFQTRHGIPSGASLEGFLYPATYEIAIEGTAYDLLDQLLTAFDQNYTPQMMSDATAAGFNTYEVVTLASIVEREAVLAAERPQIASVYLNRLTIGQKLDADPTIQYAIGNTRDGNWWTPLTQADYQLNDPYNTYINFGLPPGPIANPSLSSIRAVIYPSETPYYYFRAACDGSGAHQFSTTYEEHLSKACP